jgi:hypothetical protein
MQQFSAGYKNNSTIISTNQLKTIDTNQKTPEIVLKS